MKSSDVNALLKIGDRAVGMARKIVALADAAGFESPKRKRRKSRTIETPKPGKKPKGKPKGGPADATEE